MTLCWREIVVIFSNILRKQVPPFSKIPSSWLNYLNFEMLKMTSRIKHCQTYTTSHYSLYIYRCIMSWIKWGRNKHLTSSSAEIYIFIKAIANVEIYPPLENPNLRPCNSYVVFLHNKNSLIQGNFIYVRGGLLVEGLSMCWQKVNT